MNKKNGIIITSAIMILALAASGTFFIINKSNKLKERTKTIELIESYASEQNYSKALELLNSLINSNTDDIELIQLVSVLKKQKSNYESEQKLKAELVSQIKSESLSVFEDNILDEFLKLKNELLKLDPNSSIVEKILQNIEKDKSKLLSKIEILMNSMLNAKTEEEADALKNMIYDLIEESESDFLRSQVESAEAIKDELLIIDPDNTLAKEMEDTLVTLKKELESKEEREAINKKVDILMDQVDQFLSENKFKEAEEVRKEIIKLDPQNNIGIELEEQIIKLEKDKIMNDKIDDLLNNANKAFTNRKLESAEEYRQEILKLDPTNKEAIDLKNKIDKKKEEIFNESVDDLLKKTNKAIENGQLEFAENLRQEIIKLDPGNIEIENIKDKIASKEKDIFNQKVKDLLEKTNKAIENGQLDFAEDLRQEVLKLSPKNADAIKLKETIKLKQKELEEKKEQEKKNEIIKLVKLAKENLKINNLLDSEDQFSNVLLLDNNNLDALKGLADISIINSKNDPSEIPRTIRKVLKVLSKEPNNLTYLISLSELYEKSKDFSNELNILQQILKLDPNAKYYVKAGVASYKVTLYDDAETYFYMAMDLDPNYPEIYYPLALTYEKLEDNDQRGAMLSKGVELRPDHAATLYELGRFYTDQEKFDDALQLFLKAQEIKGEGVKYQMGVALAYFNLEEFDKSIEIYESILDLDKTISEVYYNLSMARIKLEDYDQALTDISFAIKLKPNSPTYIYTIGQISELLGRDDNATSYYLAAVQMDNNYYKPMLNLGNIYDKFGRYEDGLKILKLAYALKPEDAGVRFSLGTSYLHNKMYKESLSLLEESYNSDNNSPLKLFNLSLAYTEVGESDKAENGFKRVLGLDSNYFDAYYYLGQLLFTVGKKDEARTYFEKVLELNPEYKYKDKILEVL